MTCRCEPDRAPSILCVDDNPTVAEALRVKLTREGSFEWKGALRCAEELPAACAEGCPDLVLLDVDMPGKSPFDALPELLDRCPNVRVVMFTGHVHRELIERSLDAGAWGYVSKNDGEGHLVAALHRVSRGDLGFSPEAERVYHS